jgi:hypothetical protein
VRSGAGCSFREGPNTSPAQSSRRTERRIIVRYEHANPGDLVHIDVKKLGRIPDGGGWRTLGRPAGRKNRHASVKVGYSFLHSTIDDHSRVVYSEILGDEKQDTATEFWKRANTFYGSLATTVNATGPGSSTTPSGISPTNTLARTGPKRMGRSNGSTALSRSSGPTPTTTVLTLRGRRPMTPGSTATTTTGPIPASAANPPSTVFTTSVGRKLSTWSPRRR